MLVCSATKHLTFETLKKIGNFIHNASFQLIYFCLKNIFEQLNLFKCFSDGSWRSGVKFQYGISVFKKSGGKKPNKSVTRYVHGVSALIHV